MTGQSGETIPLANWRFLPDRDGSVSAMDAWRQPGFPDTGWSEAGTGPWNDINPRLKDFLGTGLYRARITIPAKWFNRRILFNLYSFDGPVAYDAASFWINGKLAAKYKKRFWSQTFNYDVTDLVHPGENVVAVQVDGGKEFAGLCGSAWLSPLRSLDPTVDLQGEWSTYDAAFKLAHKLNVPGRAVARYAARSFDVPGAWRNHNVYLRFKTADLWVGSIVINGRPIVYNSSMHPFGTISDVNLTPYVHFGTTNRLEIWPHWTASIPASSHAVTNLQLDQVLVGCEAK
jgi:hypothetical protein